MHHNDFSKGHSTKCLCDDIDKPEKMNFHWEKPCMFMKKPTVKIGKFQEICL